MIVNEKLIIIWLPFNAVLDFFFRNFNVFPMIILLKTKQFIRKPNLLNIT